MSMLSISGSMIDLAPGGRLAVVDIYPAESMLRPPRRIKGAIRRVLPLRPRLHTMAICRLAVNLIRRGPVTAWQIYRLQTHRP
jgi:hypothetical protein